MNERTTKIFADYSLIDLHKIILAASTASYAALHLNTKDKIKEEHINKALSHYTFDTKTKARSPKTNGILNDSIKQFYKSFIKLHFVKRFMIHLTNCKKI